MAGWLAGSATPGPQRREDHRLGPRAPTQLRSLVTQLRERGQNAVIFDLTGAFVEAFYNPESDTILNPMDQRCVPWTIFNDCELYADFLTAATALIPLRFELAAQRVQRLEVQA